LGLIDYIKRFATVPDYRVIKGIGDDCAVISAGQKTVVSTDLLVEDQHFILSKTTPYLLGRKILSVNISDIAAMGCRPSFVLLSIAAPAGFLLNDLNEILRGFFERAKEDAVTLVGGDTCRGDKLVFSVTIMGEANPPQPVYRKGARPDNFIFVTGNLGDSALGLQRLLELNENISDTLIEEDLYRGPIMAHLDPPGRVDIGEDLIFRATSMIDLSDGIQNDLARILEESGNIGAVIETSKLPASDEYKKHYKIKTNISGDALSMAVSGGEDYELLFTAGEGFADCIYELSEKHGVLITKIGYVTDGEGILFVDENGREVKAPAPWFSHFSIEK
jgi:thiamine-monophosphate kinase